MYISHIFIKNFRNFKEFKIELNKLSIIIGENDAGKSNLLEALNLVLYNDKINFSTRRLSVNDFNKEIMDELFLYLDENVGKDLDEKIVEELKAIIPTVEIRLRFVEPKNEYEKALLRDWIDGDENQIYFDIKYEFKPKDIQEFIEVLFNNYKENSKYFPLDYYDYDIISCNNNKKIDYKKYKNFVSNIVSADRDIFSNSESQGAISFISKILLETTNEEDKVTINELYTSFFDELKKITSFKDIFSYIDESKIENIKGLIDKLKLIPNNKSFKSIFSNIKIGYGSEQLNEKGLGMRNLICIIILYSYFNHKTNKIFNIVSVEEPEAHLCMNNLKLLLDFMVKYLANIEEDSLTQLIITSHSPYVINKLKISNVIVINKNIAINLKDVSEGLTKYLVKKPNFDTLRLLFSKRIILVEGITEELYFNTLLSKESKINIVDVININQTGFKTFMDIWLNIHKNDSDYKLMVVKDYDDHETSKMEHLEYQKNNDNIRVSVTEGYTFEIDLINEGENKTKILSILGNNIEDIDKYMTTNKNKSEDSWKICQAISDEEILLDIPKYIKENYLWIIED